MRFIIAGVTRSGTTSLYNYLASHPNIGVAKGGPRREVHFFDYNKHYERGTDWYEAQFPKKAVTGDTSPTMLEHLIAPKRLLRHYPDIRIILLLRNPIERTYSDYWLARRKKWVSETFEESLRKESARLQHDLQKGRFWRNRYFMSHHHLRGFKRRSQYAAHIERWLQIFKQEQVRIIKSEDLFANAQSVVDAVCAFLEQDSVRIDPKVWHKGKYPKMKPQTRKKLAHLFAPHNKQLEALLGRRFGWK